MTQDPAALIVYYHLDDPYFDECWSTSAQKKEVSMLAKASRWTNRPWFFSHRGQDNDLFSRKSTLEHLKIDSADYDPGFSMSWDEITDQLAIKLLEFARQKNKKIFVSWSGGIDSSLVLVALLKWANAEDMGRLVVATKKSAVWENGYLFDLVVKKSIILIDYDRAIMYLLPDNADGFIFVNGEPADQLLIGIDGSTELALQDQTYTKISWKETVHLKSYLSRYVNDVDLMQWMIDKVQSNIENHSTPVTSCYDFVWWICFNYVFSSSSTAEYALIFKRWSKLSFDIWHQNHYAWFADALYQKWAMANCGQTKILFGPNQNQWKWPAKKYMFDYTKDYYYLNYKTKVGSIGRKSHSGSVDPRWICMDKDNNFYSRHENPEQTRLLLTSSINPRFATNV